MTPKEAENKRSSLDTMSTKAIAGLVAKDPALQEKLDKALAYGVANMKVTKVPIVGAGGGEGVMVIKETNHRLYFTVSRFDVGGGWGARSYKVLMLLNTQTLVDKWADGEWLFEAGAEASAGTAATAGSSNSGNEGFSIHVLADGGASATATARVIRVKIESDLSKNP